MKPQTKDIATKLELILFGRWYRVGKKATHKDIFRDRKETDKSKEILVDYRDFIKKRKHKWNKKKA